MAFSSSIFTAPPILKKISKGNLSSPLSSSASKISPKIKTSRIKFIRPSSSTIKPEEIYKKSSIDDTLVETNRILVEIQKQLALDFAMRIVDEKQKNKTLKQEKSREKLRLKEGAIESVRKIGGAIKKTAQFVAAPFKGFFDKILEFITLLGLGIGANATFKWFKDPENQKKMTKFFNILRENWKTIALITGALVGGILIAKIIGFVLALKGLSAFLLNPLTLTAIGLLAATVFAMTAKTTSENLASIVGDDDNKRRQMIKGFEQMREMDDEKLKQVSGQEPRGFRAELNKQIYFLKTGRPLLYDRGKKGLFPPSYRKMADSATFREKMAFSEFVDKGARPQGMFEGPAVVQPIEQRAMGGPVIAGNTYLVGESGPEIFAPNVDGSIINNMRTEKIYQMISSKDAGKINFITMELPPKVMKKEQQDSTQQTESPVPSISPVNGSNPYMNITPEIYGIYV